MLKVSVLKHKNSVSVAYIHQSIHSTTFPDYMCFCISFHSCMHKSTAKFFFCHCAWVYIYTDNVTEQANCFDGEVRLVGGQTEGEGRVEVCASRAWGTVCSAGFGFQESQIVCRQLGLQELGKHWILISGIVAKQVFALGAYYCANGFACWHQQVQKLSTLKTTLNPTVKPVVQFWLEACPALEQKPTCYSVTEMLPSLFWTFPV